ncbi:hypothetical protein BDK51DRAFT_50077 [Blyttiomyces helicus]|uniref:Uncharacterized protein n=1 Tax=Blyttiomyces helicus TaxID=388810 RepID=A0A4P9W5I2_9FUNG|nr:hypothetical protein BDK51DRAFT_50077 [Blyttiomyces helicus]|eukprot:RKO86168.1 hypothetical protein BDK51DRAFT_50077 [Blyttiomyces helicus]
MVGSQLHVLSEKFSLSRVPGNSLTLQGCTISFGNSLVLFWTPSSDFVARETGSSDQCSPPHDATLAPGSSPPRSGPVDSTTPFVSAMIFWMWGAILPWFILDTSAQRTLSKVGKVTPAGSVKTMGDLRASRLFPSFTPTSPHPAPRFMALLVADLFRDRSIFASIDRRIPHEKADRTVVFLGLRLQQVPPPSSAAAAGGVAQKGTPGEHLRE